MSPLCRPEIRSIEEKRRAGWTWIPRRRTMRDMSAAVSFDRVQHMIRVPVQLAGDPYQFLVDTGIGITIVSSAVAGRPDVQPTGETFTGRRMSGQAVEVPLVRLPRLDVGGYTVDAHVAGVADLGDPDGPNGFAG